MQRRASWAVWLSVGLVTAVAVHSLLNAPPKGHDFNLHYYRISLLNALWEQDIFFSRWSPDLVFGYGSPLFNFYPPLSAYLLTVCYWLVGQHAPAAYNLAFALALAATAAGMFLLGRHLFGSRGGLLVSAAYTLSPWLLYQTYQRGSLSNAWAMAFFPWALWGVFLVVQQPSRRRVAGTAVAIAALMLSHTAASLLFLAPLIALGLLYLWLNRPSASTRHSSPFFLAILLGLSLTAFAWLPALREFQFTKYEAEAGRVDSAAYFADAWSWPPRMIAGINNPPLPKSPGVGQIALGLAAGGVAAGRLWRKKRPSTSDAIILASALIGLGGLFLATAPSSWLWTNLGVLANFQFPWRFLDLPTFFFALAVGGLAIGDGRLGKNLQSPISNLWLVLFFANAVPYFYPPRMVDLPRQPTLADVAEVQQAYGIYGLTAWGEYSAAAVTTWPDGPAFPGAALGAPLAAKLRPADGFTLLSAEGGPLAATWQVYAREETLLTFFVHDFPGWQAEVDGRPFTSVPDEEGRIQVVVPGGEHTVSLRWGRTPVRWLADGLSVAAVVALLWLVVSSKRLSSPGKRSADYRFLITDYFLLLTLTLLLLLKVAWLDRADSPWLVQPRGDGVIAGLSQPEWGDFGGLVRLAGYDLAQPDELTLYWHALQPLEQVYSTAVTLVDGRGVPVKTTTHTAPGESATTTWQPGELVRDVFTLPLDAGSAPTGYRVQVALLAPDGQPVLLQDAPPEAAPWVEVGQTKRGPEETTVPATAVPINALFAAAIRLTHADFPAQVAGEEAFVLTLYWQVETAVATDYTVFIHLLDAEGHLMAGNDGQPFGGVYPTSFWSPGEILADAHPWQLNLLPGTYEIRVGLYQLETGQRLPLATSGDSIAVGQVTIR